MESLRDRVSRHEGKCLETYRCSEGKLTIGVGRNIEANPLPPDIAEYFSRHKRITSEQADRMLDEDLADCAREVERCLPWTRSLERIRLEVLIEMCFQMGINGLLQFKNMLAALESGDVDTASQEMLKSSWHRQTPARAEELASLMLKGGI